MSASFVKQLSAVLAVGALSFGVVACGSDDDGETVRDSDSDSESGSGSESASASGEAVCDPFGNAAEADTTVNVTLSEFAIATGASEVPAGLIHFAIENAGAEVHEVVVVRAASAADLPVDDAGAFVESDFPAADFLGEVEGFPSGQTCDGTFAMTPGNYVLLCNLVEEEANGETEAHLHEGMAVGLTVT